MEDSVLYVAGIIKSSVVDGPGIRAVLFLQGCPHHCPGCHNPETWQFQKEGTKRSIDSVAAELAALPRVNKLTFSGGEPMEQAAALVELLDVLKEKYDRTYHLVCYTGYTFNSLLTVDNPGIQALLQRIDLLIDSPYIEELKTLDLPFRGSSNQRIIDLKQSLMLNQMVIPEQYQ